MATGRLPDPNSSPLTAKGDLYTYSTVPAKLAVGNNGDTLVADSSATTGLRWQGSFAAGKNKIINGDFYINQRGFTSNTANNAYNFDRFLQINSGGTATVTPQVFSTGSAPVTGYEGKNFVRIVTASQSSTSDYAAIGQKIESVRTLANQSAVISFWAKASTGTPNIGVTLEQSFGAGGSSTVVTSIAKQVISTSWTRYSFTVAVPSISGKTIGSGGDDKLNVYIFTSCGSGVTGYSTDVGIQNATIDIWGVQVEAGSVATPFTIATGTLAGELAACQRYYSTSTTTGSHSLSTTQVISAPQTDLLQGFRFPVAMRSAPTVTIFSRNGTSGKVSKTTDGTDIGGTVTAANIGNNQVWGLSTSGLTAGTAGYEMSFTASAEL